MFEKTIVNDQAGAQDHNESSIMKRVSELTRRAFLERSMFAASGIALSSLLPSFGGDIDRGVPPAYPSGSASAGDHGDQELGQDAKGCFEDS